MNVVAAALATGITNDNAGTIDKTDAEKVAKAFLGSIRRKRSITTARKAYADSEKFLDMAVLATVDVDAKSKLVSARHAAKSHLQDMVDIKNGFVTEGQLRAAARDYVLGPLARANDYWSDDMDAEVFFDVDDQWHGRARANIVSTLNDAEIPYSAPEHIMMVYVSAYDSERELIETNVAVDRVSGEVLGHYKNYAFHLAVED
jgi:hypothetical protein